MNEGWMMDELFGFFFGIKYLDANYNNKTAFFWTHHCKSKKWPSKWL